MTMIRLQRFRGLACAACFLVAGAGEPAAAQATSQGALPEAIRQCMTVRNSVERLACYDTAAARLAAGVTSQATPEEMFGIQAQHNRTQPAAAPERAEVTSIEARVARLRETKDGSVLIDLDNGQVWRQEDSATLLLKVGDVVTISRGALKSFRLSTPTKRSARVKRIR